MILYLLKWEDGQAKVSIGIMKEGVLVEHDIGSMEEVADKINNAVNTGKTTIDEIQETTIDVLKNIFGPKEEEEVDTTVVQPSPGTYTHSSGSDDSTDPNKTDVSIVDKDGDGVYSDVDYDDTDANVQTKAHTIFGKSDDTGKKDEVSANDAQSDETREKIIDLQRDANTNNNKTRTEVDVGGEDEFEKKPEDIFETETSVASGLGGGGLFQGTTAEALGRFMPKKIVQPVPFARRAATYKRPRYSLFSEYI